MENSHENPSKQVLNLKDSTAPLPDNWKWVSVEPPPERQLVIAVGLLQDGTYLTDPYLCWTSPAILGGWVRWPHPSAPVFWREGPSMVELTNTISEWSYDNQN